MIIFKLLYKAIRKLKIEVIRQYGNILTGLLFYLNGVKVGPEFQSNGIPKINVTGTMSVGKRFKMNDGKHFNIIGRQQPCIFNISGYLEIGDNVGMSSTAIICQEKISIGNNVKIGGNVVIYDTDFHALDTKERCKIPEDRSNVKTQSITIGSNVFIGAHSTILKGVDIGDNSIIGACSLVSRNIPSNEIWAGNPIRFIKRINHG